MIVELIRYFSVVAHNVTVNAEVNTGVCVSRTSLNKRYHCSIVSLGSLNISSVLQGAQERSSMKASIESKFRERICRVFWPGCLKILLLEFKDTKIGR